VEFDEIWLSLAIYPLVLVGAALLHYREAKESPEKGRRYALLPIRIKAICWVLVCGGIAAMPLAPWTWFISLICLVWAEAAATRWYVKNGHLSP
jgi:hypothetical protein